MRPRFGSSGVTPSGRLPASGRSTGSNSSRTCTRCRRCGSGSPGGMRVALGHGAVRRPAPVQPPAALAWHRMRPSRHRAPRSVSSLGPTASMAVLSPRTATWRSRLTVGHSGDPLRADDGQERRAAVTWRPGIRRLVSFPSAALVAGPVSGSAVGLARSPEPLRTEPSIPSPA